MSVPSGFFRNPNKDAMSGTRFQPHFSQQSSWKVLETAAEVTIVLLVLPYHLRYVFLGMLEFTTIINNYPLFQLDVLPSV